MVPDAIVRVLDALTQRGCRVRRVRPDRWRATCPSHTDRDPSLSISLSHGRVLLHDFGGCSTGHVLTALGLTSADLRGTEPLPALEPQAVVAIYDYVDAAFAVVARKQRWGPRKSFRWQRRVNGTWRDGLRGVTILPYGIEYVIDASRVIIVEGEKAVDTLCARARAATCGAFGASAWHDHWTETIWRASGAREIVILPDNDPIGRHHALAVARSVAEFRPPSDADGHPLVVRVVELPGLPRGADVVDWLIMHTIDDLDALIAATPPWQPEDPASRRRRLRAARNRRWRATRRQASQSATRSLAEPPHGETPVSKPATCETPVSNTENETPVKLISRSLERSLWLRRSLTARLASRETPVSRERGR